MERIFGKDTILMCLAILRLGASFISGNSNPSDSGSVSIAFLILPMLFFIFVVCCGSVDLARFLTYTSTAYMRLHFSQRKSSMYSVLKMPSKQAPSVVPPVLAGTFKVNEQKVDRFGAGLKPQVKHSI